MSFFIPSGVVAALAGLALLVAAIRHQAEQQPRYKAMLIGGMMLTAFGLILAAFAIAYRSAAPLDLNAGGGR